MESFTYILKNLPKCPRKSWKCLEGQKVLFLLLRVIDSLIMYPPCWFYSSGPRSISTMKGLVLQQLILNVMLDNASCRYPSVTFFKMTSFAFSSHAFFLSQLFIRSIFMMCILGMVRFYLHNYSKKKYAHHLFLDCCIHLLCSGCGLGHWLFLAL